MFVVISIPVRIPIFFRITSSYLTSQVYFFGHRCLIHTAGAYFPQYWHGMQSSETQPEAPKDGNSVQASIGRPPELPPYLRELLPPLPIALLMPPRCLTDQSMKNDQDVISPTHEMGISEKTASPESSSGATCNDINRGFSRENNCQQEAADITEKYGTNIEGVNNPDPNVSDVPLNCLIVNENNFGKGHQKHRRCKSSPAPYERFRENEQSRILCGSKTE